MLGGGELMSIVPQLMRVANVDGGHHGPRQAAVVISVTARSHRDTHMRAR